MTRLILVILSAILAACCLCYTAFAVVFKEPNTTTFIVLIIGCVLAKCWQWLINTDPDVDIHIE